MIKKYISKIFLLLVILWLLRGFAYADDFYSKGLAYMGSKEWEKAIEMFTRAISIEYGDKLEFAPDMTYFWEYFPHREMGICYYNLGDYENAKKELEISLNFYPSEKAKEYLNKVTKLLVPSEDLQKQNKPTTISEPPRLYFNYSLIDANGDKILDGGEKIILTVNIKNQGNGNAKGVKVLLSGNSKVLSYLGREKEVGDILSGSERVATFETVLPYQIEADQGNIIIKVTEVQGFGALEEKELKIAMQPAKVERKTEVVSVLVDVDQPLTPSSLLREDAYAVIIGITNYRSDRIPAVKYAKRDAETVKDYLIKICGIPEENIICLTDDKATGTDLIAYIEEWLQRNVSKNSFVFVYFAGHGTPNPEKGDAYLVPYDGEPGFISKLYPLSRFYSSLEKLPTENIVVALDACFSGAGGRSVIEEGKRPLVPVKIPEAVKKVAVITASAADEISQDLDAKRHGLFTYYVLRGLRGEADANGDNWITLGELYNYCQPKVLLESKKLGYTQTPKVFPEPLGAKTNLKIGKAR